MAQVVPTITAENPHVYREQIERVQNFAKRIHIDLMDGRFTPNKSIEVKQAWLPQDITSDIHLMFENPQEALEDLLKLKPHLVVIPAEATINFAEFADALHGSGIKCGLALLKDTSVETIKDKLAVVDSVTIFSGNLGYQGGSVADLDLLEKVAKSKALNPDIEVGWDGGINETNVRALSAAGVEVLNTGGYIQYASDPEEAYKLLESLVV